MATTRKKFTAKLRHEAINLVLEQNMSVEQAAKKKGVGKSTLAKWVSSFKNNGHKIDMDDDLEPIANLKETSPKLAELQSLKSAVKLLKQEKEILKKTIAILMADYS